MSLKTAIIIAGGKGTRLKQYTQTLPKPLIPINGIPLIERIIQWLKSNGVENLIVGVAYKKEMVKTFLGDGSKYGLKITYTEHDENGGTGDAFKAAIEQSGIQDDNFYAMNGDQLTDLNLSIASKAHIKSKAFATLITVNLRTNFGIIKTSSNDNILEFQEKPEIENILMNSGIYIFNKAIKKYITGGSIERDTFKKLAKKRKIKSFHHQGLWSTVNDEKQLKKMKTYIEKTGLDYNMGEKHSKIAIVIGTKAELIKCMPIMLELQKQKKEYWFIHTGQHPFKDACKEFGIKNPDYILSEAPDSKKGTKFHSKISKSAFKWAWKNMFEIRKLLKKLNPKYVIFHGDTMNTAMAIGASSWVLNPFKEWKTVHLEAGLRSGSLKEPFPEEFTRQIVDKFSDVLLAVSDKSEKNLKKEINFAKGEIINVGNTGVDASLIAYDRAKKKYKKLKYEYALINVHRFENLRSYERMKNIVEIIKKINVKAIWPIHETTKNTLKKYGLIKDLEKMENLEIVPLEGYFKFIFLLANCKYLLTDGGSIQEESLLFKKPCLILRKYTERQEGFSTGINFLTKLDVNKTKKIIEKIEHNEIKINKFKNPYGEKGLSKKIVEILK
jgi:UDP-N-acetylglucosamine 2-epimerase (non-hydrolysing)